MTSTSISHESTRSAPHADLNLVLLKYLARFLEDNYGLRAVEDITTAAGVSVGDFITGSGWISHEQFEALLARSRALMDDDATFVKACAYKAQSINGAMSLAISSVFPPASTYHVGVARMPLVTRMSTFECHTRARNRVTLTYRTTKRESRLMCLSRQAQIRAFPTLWRAPPAHLDETSCVAWGDETCCYDVRVIEVRRWVPPLLGCAAASGLAVAAGMATRWWAFALVGALLGYLYEAWRLASANRKTREQVDAAFVQMAHAEATARLALSLAERRAERPDLEATAARSAPEPSAALPGDLELDESTLTARFAAVGAPLRLSRSQFALLHHLAHHPGEWVSVTTLQQEVLGTATSQPDPSNVRYHVHQLRLRLEEHGPNFVQFVHSEPRLGYMWSPAPCDRRHCTERSPARPARAELS